MPRPISLAAVVILAAFTLPANLAAAAPGPQGYYRMPALRGDTVVFVSEGDLWKVPLAGGAARRLTSHSGDESSPAISPDGGTVAFTAQYEGPTEVYTMPLTGGLPSRLTHEGGAVVGWTPDGRVIFTTTVYSTLPNPQLMTVDPATGAAGMIPLAQASDGVYDESGRTLFFTRLAFQGSQTKRYKGGTAQNLWRFAEGDSEARPLTGDYAGTSRRAMWWQGRVYFASDRDGCMNLWSMTPDGGDLRQHTRHSGMDVLGPSMDAGKIVYQLGADLRVLDVASGKDEGIEITLDSDFDQTRERWVRKPLEYMTSARVSPDGDRVALTARGRVFVAPHRQGRLVEADRQEGVRYRDARFMPDGKTLLAMSDESGEVEFWTLPANGVGEAQQITRDGDVLRWEGVPSPDGRWVAHHDKNQRLWLLNMETKENRKIDESPVENVGDIRWSPDSGWIAYAIPGENLYRRVKLYRVADGTTAFATTDRYDSYSPAWSPDGKWLYFLSDRNLVSVVQSVWGPLQPEPFFDKTTKVYQLALTAGERSPFAPKDELHPADKDKSKDKDKGKDKDKKEPGKSDDDKAEGGASDKADEEKKGADGGEGKKDKKVEVVIDLDGLEARLIEAPVPPGNYGGLAVNDKALFWLSSDSGDRKTALQAATITNENFEVKTVLGDLKSYEMTADGKKLLVHKGDTLAIVDANAGPADLDKKNVDLSAWTLSVTPREEWRQMFTEAWRLERDYFYDPAMHGVDWKAILDKYRPLVDRVATRAELSDLIAQMVSELSALHIFVRGGDVRSGDDNIRPASLGAVLERDEAAGGYRVKHIYRADPDEPAKLSPLMKPGVDVKEGEVIEAINGDSTLKEAPSLLLRNKAGQQVLLRVKAEDGTSRDVIAVPMSPDAASNLRYDEWTYTRRKLVDEWSGGKIGYVHLRAMGGDNIAEWARSYYPVFQRQGLIVDVRHNRGGNIDSWILSRLMRKAWFYWSQRVGQSPTWNMQYAFRGPMVALCNERTASDGEAFAEGFRRLGLGKVIGTRTWGGEVWLSANNFLVDRGIATAAESGVYGPEGEWLIEGHGVEPDIIVDNLPHATFKGEDAQLRAAVDQLLKEIAEKKLDQPAIPKYPDKSYRAPGK